MAEATSFKISVIADLDKDAIESSRTWKSLIRNGKLNYSNSSVTVEFSSDDAHEIQSHYSYKGRGMELSDLLMFNNKLYTVGDKTGIVYEIADREEDGKKVIPWVILSSGDGRQDEGFKGEWMTIRDGKMIIGGHGKELTGYDGSIINHDYMWIKSITKEGVVEHLDWRKNFNAIREKAGMPYPGYLTHESGAWSNIHNSWFFLPRKGSCEAYDHKKDEQMGTNLLIKCSEDFSDITVKEIGEIEKRKGYSSFKFIPGTNDQAILAIRSEEIDDKCKTYITAFGIDGKILMPDVLVSDKSKYEGLEIFQ